MTLGGSSYLQANFDLFFVGYINDGVLAAGELSALGTWTAAGYNLRFSSSSSSPCYSLSFLCSLFFFLWWPDMWSFSRVMIRVMTMPVSTLVLEFQHQTRCLIVQQLRFVTTLLPLFHLLTPKPREQLTCYFLDLLEVWRLLQRFRVMQTLVNEFFLSVCLSN